MKPLNILLLEDSEEDAMLVLATLNQSDLVFKHKHAHDQFEFLEQIRNGDLDIILSDYGLRGYNGLAALRDKKEQGITCPFIMVTGSLPDEIAVECLKAGVDDYVLKDRLSRLPEAIQRALDRERAEAERRETFTELIKSQKRLEAAERMAKVGNWEWDLTTGQIIWSDGMYDIMGVERGKYLPSVSSFMEFIMPEDFESSLRIADEIAKGQVTDAEDDFRIRTVSGEIKMMRSKRKSNGQSLESGEMKIFGTMQDITLQFLTEKALRDMTEQLEHRVAERTSELQRSKEQLERKNLEMTDSINYARLIQSALLAKLDSAGRLIQKSFVIWLPRDIVSGDFYWKYQTERYDFVAAVDCTGHGVPGALMSMIGHQLLNEVVIRNGIIEPAEVLQELDKSVARSLFHHDSEASVHDGMDIILCRIDRVEGVLTFSGALRPLYFVSDGEVVEYKGNRQAVGSFRYLQTVHQFIQHAVEFKNGDMAYLTTDGYYDQFGGPQGRKMMKARFRRLLSETSCLPIDIQHNTLMNYLKEWQDKEDQVDDILVIGIQF